MWTGSNNNLTTQREHDDGHGYEPALLGSRAMHEHSGP